MRRRTNRRHLLAALLVLVAVAFGIYAWRHRPAPAPESPPAPTPVAKESEAAIPLVIPIDRVDPANEGRLVSLTGELTVHQPAEDSQTGISAKAVMLLRYADMLQWQERCKGEDCTYQQVWSPQPIDSSRFREPAGHQNPGRLPMVIARFASADVRIGAFKVDASTLGNDRLRPSLKVSPIPYPVTTAQLPSNLAITFRDYKGALYAGDPEHRKIGDARLIYRIIPAGKVEIVGIQRGSQIIVRSSKPLPSS
jgi:Transmembrane protein 43